MVVPEKKTARIIRAIGVAVTKNKLQGCGCSFFPLLLMVVTFMWVKDKACSPPEPVKTPEQIQVEQKEEHTRELFTYWRATCRDLHDKAIGEMSVNDLNQIETCKAMGMW